MNKDLHLVTENENAALAFTVHKEQAEEPAQEAVPPGSLDYVAATLSAWNQCPTIVKKQLDAQYEEIRQLREEVKLASAKLNQRKQEFERHAGVEMKVALLKHKDRIEGSFRQKLEEEKKALTKKKVEEMDMVLQENFALKKELLAVKKDAKKN